MAFKFCRDDATQELYFAALFDWFSIQIFLSYPFYSSWIAPDGSNQCSFCRQCGRSSLLTKCNRLRLNHASINWLFIINFDFSPSFCRHLSIGCATALPMGVAPEGYRLKDYRHTYFIYCVFWYFSTYSALLVILLFFSYDLSPLVQN
jgi:hypothetical protein